MLKNGVTAHRRTTTDIPAYFPAARPLQPITIWRKTQSYSPFHIRSPGSLLKSDALVDEQLRYVAESDGRWV